MQATGRQFRILSDPIMGILLVLANAMVTGLVCEPREYTKS